MKDNFALKVGQITAASANFAQSGQCLAGVTVFGASCAVKFTVREESFGCLGMKLARRDCFPAGFCPCLPGGRAFGGFFELSFGAGIVGRGLEETGRFSQSTGPGRFKQLAFPEHLKKITDNNCR